MSLEWRRRVAARRWLLLRPGDCWDWLLVEGGVAQRQGQGEPPADLQARVALVVPAGHCSHFQLPAPPGLRREEWPLLLEDCLLQGADDVVCACLGRDGGQVRLLAVDRQRLQGWRAQCAEWGLPVERCWTEFQLLPAPEAGVAWQWRRAGVNVFKGVTEAGHERWLAWPETLGEVCVEPWSGLGRVPLEGCWPTSLASLDALPSLFEQRRARSLSGPSRPQQRVLAACLALACAWGGLWVHQHWRQAQVWQAQVLAVTGEQGSPRQAAQALRQLRETETQQQLRWRQLEDLQGRLDAWLREHPDWRLQRVHFDGLRWELRLQGDGTAPPWAEMAEAAGAQLQVVAGGTQAHVVFDLGAAT